MAHKWRKISRHQGNEKCQRELRRAQIASSMSLRNSTLRLWAGVARALPNDLKANNFRSFPTLLLLLIPSFWRPCLCVCVHAYVCACTHTHALGEGQVDKGIETPASDFKPVRGDDGIQKVSQSLRCPPSTQLWQRSRPYTHLSIGH